MRRGGEVGVQGVDGGGGGLGGDGGGGGFEVAGVHVAEDDGGGDWRCEALGDCAGVAAETGGAVEEGEGCSGGRGGVRDERGQDVVEEDGDVVVGGH